MTAYRASDKDILAKVRRGEQLTQDEQTRLFSRTAAPGLTYAEGSGEVGGYEGGTVSTSRGEDTGYGNIAGAVTGLGMQAAGVPGGRTTSGLVNDALSGKSNAEMTANAAVNTLGDVMGMVGGLPGMAVNAGISLATSDDLPATAASIAGGIFGSMAGPFGSMAGSALGRAALSSFRDGLLGDATDARSYEGARDRAEALGYSHEQTANAADVQAGRDAFADAGYSGVDPGVSSSGVGVNPGLSDMEGGVAAAGRGSLSGTTGSALGNAAAGAFGDIDSAFGGDGGDGDSGGYGGDTGSDGMGGMGADGAGDSGYA